jgi:hypothetical protein
MTLINAKTNRATEYTFELFHEVSQKWLSDLDFWKDEIAFFYKLLRIKTPRQSEVLKTEHAKAIEKHLINVSVEKIDALKKEILDHEQFLTRIMADIDIDEDLYFSRHKAITQKFRAFEKEYRALKHDIFALAEEIRK